MKRVFLYLVVIMDWLTRKVLSWHLSNTMDVEFCIEALREALQHPGDFQHGPGLTIHDAPFRRDTGRASDPYQHGRAWALARRTPDEARQKDSITTTGYSLFKPKNCPNGRVRLCPAWKSEIETIKCHMEGT